MSTTTAGAGVPALAEAAGGPIDDAAAALDDAALDDAALDDAAGADDAAGSDDAAADDDIAGAEADADAALLPVGCAIAAATE